MGNSATTVPLQDHDGGGPRNKKGSRDLHGGLDPINNKKKKSAHRKDMIPEPDYGGDRGKGESNNGIQFSDEGLVVPKKPSNPCLQSSERQNLHRELLFNQKIGKSVIGQKTELQRAMDKFRDEQKKKELEEEKTQKKSALEKKLEEQANKLKQQEEENERKVDPGTADQPEFLRVHARVCAQAVVDPTS